MSENHKRSIATTLTLVDEALCEFEEWIGGRESHGVLYHERNQLTPKDRNALLAEIRRAREMMREVQDRLNLAIKVKDVAKSICACCWSLLDPVTEMKGRYLRRYGEPPPNLVEYLDPKVVQLEDSIQRISRIAAQSGDHPRMAINLNQIRVEHLDDPTKKG